MKDTKEKMQKCTFTLSEKGIKALEMFSEFTSIPKSVVVRLAHKACEQIEERSNEDDENLEVKKRKNDKIYNSTK